MIFLTAELVLKNLDHFLSTIAQILVYMIKNEHSNIMIIGEDLSVERPMFHFHLESKIVGLHTPL